MSINVNTEACAEHKQSTAKMVIAATAGNVLEWFDYSLYAFFAVVFSTNFFPANDPVVSLLMSFWFWTGVCGSSSGGLYFRAPW